MRDLGLTRRSSRQKGEALTSSGTERQADDGKLRCTCATWDDAVVMLKGEALALVNIERQAERRQAPLGHARPGTSFSVNIERQADDGSPLHMRDLR